MDLFAEGLQFARQRFHGNLVQGDVFEYSFDRTFDLIGAFDVIEHLDDDEKILCRLSGQLRPGGHLVVTVPAHKALWSYFDEAAHHRRRYAPAELKRKLAATGFSDVFVTQFMAALFPAMWLKRRLGGCALKLSHAGPQQQQDAAESDLRVNPILNRITEWLLWPEPALISRHRSLPLGTSLLAIGTRPSNA
jgi:SAM-dependent methyltransferase